MIHTGLFTIQSGRQPGRRTGRQSGRQCVIHSGRHSGRRSRIAERLAVVGQRQAKMLTQMEKPKDFPSTLKEFRNKTQCWSETNMVPVKNKAVGNEPWG